MTSPIQRCFLCSNPPQNTRDDAQNSLEKIHTFTCGHLAHTSCCDVVKTPLTGRCVFCTEEKNPRKIADPSGSSNDDDDREVSDPKRQKEKDPKATQEDLIWFVKIQAPSSVLPTVKVETPKPLVIHMQRNNHLTAKEQLQTSLAQKFPEAKVSFVSPAKKPCPKVAEVIIKKDLDNTIFTWENTQGVKNDIQKDGKNDKQTVLYGVASQFNGSEAVNPYQVPKSEAVKTYKKDRTQGPEAQLQFPDSQVELINNAAFDGFNGLCRVLDEKTIHLVHHGYLIVKSEENAFQLIRQLQIRGNLVEYLCIGNTPKGEGNTQQVYEMLVAAPAFGRSYNRDCTATKEQQDEIQFLCALLAYRAQFQQALSLAGSSEKPVIFKPTTPGLGVYKNEVENVAKGFYVAAKEFEPELKDHRVKVQLQVFRGSGLSREMADLMGLQKLQ